MSERRFEGEMMKTIDEKYFVCVRKFPLTVIDDGSYEQAMEMLRSLTNRRLSSGEREYRKLLEHLIKEYEKPTALDLDSLEPHELLSGMMEIHGLNQTKLSQILDCRQSHVSAILRCEKSISTETAIKLGEHFQVDPNLFRSKIRH